jgi:hypothetical protein
MKIIKAILVIIFLSESLQYAFADSCQSNELGGYFCIHDNGTTSNSIQNNAGGLDTSNSDGSWSSSIQDGTGGEETFNGDGTVSSTIPNGTGGEETFNSNGTVTSNNQININQNKSHGYNTQDK